MTCGVQWFDSIIGYMNLVKSLAPDVEKDATKITITITGYYMTEEKETAFVTTNWNVEGENKK